MDKHQYTLSNRPPKELLRPLSPDRPDVTESAYTVDTGYFQLELDILALNQDATVESLQVAPLLFKLGLSNNVDLQLGFSPYSLTRTRSERGEVVEEQAVTPDLTLRLKVNLWGNDDGPTAFALLPFITVPTQNTGSVEGGLILPFAAELTEGWSLGSSTTVAFFANAADSGYHTEFVNTLVLSHELTAELGGFVEFVSVLSTEQGSSWVASGNAGLTYALTPDLLVDIGIRLGLTSAAEDQNVFLGMTLRF
ncbi:transporter [Anthocerotibacter panamensis]|uniref:transporter n=1 Tax=Anthocerotibacter panamensis TaxID=2857077 RepID=UPI001C4042F1|nr:transporter [Anthocerotibacter panamensis]